MLLRSYWVLFCTIEAGSLKMAIFVYAFALKCTREVGAEGEKMCF